MERLFFPCLISGPDEDGWFCVIVPGLNVNAQGKTEVSALMEAAEILQDVIDDAARDGEPTPTPIDIANQKETGDRTAIIQAVSPKVAA